MSEYEPSPVLVTGASGFIGRHTARCLARQGHTVIGVGHGLWAAEEWRSWGLSDWRQTDLTLSSLEQLPVAPGAIVHCAGSSSVGASIQSPQTAFDHTVATTSSVLEYVRLHTPSCRVVYPSSASVYGSVASVPIGEEFPTSPISLYGTHKLLAEDLMRSYARQFGIHASIVRLFSVYGPGLRKQLLWDGCRKLHSGENTFMGTGDEVRDWLHVEDAAELLAAAVRRASPACPIVNGGSGEGATVREVLLQLSRALGHTQPPQFSGAPRTGDPIRYMADIEAAKQWGWLPQRRWQQGVEEYARWWIENL